MAVHNSRALTAAVIILLITGILVIVASVVTLQAPGAAGAQGSVKDGDTHPVIFVEAGESLKYFPNVTPRSANNVFFQPNGSVIPVKRLTPVPSFPSITSGTSESPYLSGYSGKFPVPVPGRLNTTKSILFPISQSKPASLKPLPTFKPDIPIVIPLPTLIPRPPAPDITIPSTIIVDGKTEQIEQRLFYYTNIERVNAGKPALIWDEQLSVIGREHCIDMATTGLFDHLNFDGETPTDRAIRHGYQVKKDLGTYVREGVGENIAKLSNHQGTPDEVARFIVDAWMNSPGHRANLLDSNEQQLTLIGVGVAYDQPTATYYAAQEFF